MGRSCSRAVVRPRATTQADSDGSLALAREWLRFGGNLPPWRIIVSDDPQKGEWAWPQWMFWID
jgi:hypothetical protein